MDENETDDFDKEDDGGPVAPPEPNLDELALQVLEVTDNQTGGEVKDLRAAAANHLLARFRPVG